MEVDGSNDFPFQVGEFFGFRMCQNVNLQRCISIEIGVGIFIPSHYTRSFRMFHVIFQGVKGVIKKQNPGWTHTFAMTK